MNGQRPDQVRMDEAPELLERLRDEQAEVDRLAPLATDLSQVGKELPPELFGPPPELVARAKAIKARRRRLGRSGFSTGSMAMPSKNARHKTRRSQ